MGLPDSILMGDTLEGTTEWERIEGREGQDKGMFQKVSYERLFSETVFVE